MRYIILLSLYLLPNLSFAQQKVEFIKTVKEQCEIHRFEKDLYMNKYVAKMMGPNPADNKRKFGAKKNDTPTPVKGPCDLSNLLDILDNKQFIDSSKEELCDVKKISKDGSIRTVSYEKFCDCLKTSDKSNSLLARIDKFGRNQNEKEAKEAYQQLYFHSIYKNFETALDSIINSFENSAAFNNTKFSKTDHQKIQRQCIEQISMLDNLQCHSKWGVFKFTKDAKNLKYLDDTGKVSFKKMQQEYRNKYLAQSELEYEGIISKEESIKAAFGEENSKKMKASDNICLTPTKFKIINIMNELNTNIKGSIDINPHDLGIELDSDDHKNFEDVHKNIKDIPAKNISSKDVLTAYKSLFSPRSQEKLVEDYTEKCNKTIRTFADASCGKSLTFGADREAVPFILGAYNDLGNKELEQGLVYLCKEKNLERVDEKMNKCSINDARYTILNNTIHSSLKVNPEESKDYEFAKFTKFNNVICNKLKNTHSVEAIENLIAGLGLSDEEKKIAEAYKVYLASDHAEKKNIFEEKKNNNDKNDSVDYRDLLGISPNVASEKLSDVSKSYTENQNANNATAHNQNNTQPNFQNFGASNYDAMASQVSSRVTEHQDKIKNADQVNSVVNNMQDALNESDSRIRDLEEQLKKKDDKAISAELAEYKRLREEMQKELERLRDDVEKRVDAKESADVRVADAEKKLKEYEAKKIAQAAMGGQNVGSVSGANGTYRSPASGSLNGGSIELGANGSAENNSSASVGHQQNISSNAQASQNKAYLVKTSNNANYLAVLERDISNGEAFAVGLSQADNTLHVVFDQDKLSEFKASDFCSRVASPADTLHIRISGKDHYIQKNSNIPQQDANVAKIASEISQCAFGSSNVVKVEEVQKREPASVEKVEVQNEEKSEDDIGQMESEDDSSAYKELIQKSSDQSFFTN
ncbi:MAG: hypothetical protein JNM93_11140 [Bacteriovoracaceae bacterium]|nr:hypothetical protein [Bacteriovoracaceae bacterium]